jgi:hypothetical protein
MLKLEARPQPSQLLALTSPLIALALTVVIGVALFVFLGKDPLRGLQMFFVEPVKSLYALSELSIKATPLILIALGRRRRGRARGCSSRSSPRASPAAWPGRRSSRSCATASTPTRSWSR